MTEAVTMTVAPTAGGDTTPTTHPASDGAGRRLIAVVVDGARQVPIYSALTIDDVARNAVLRSLSRPSSFLRPPVL